MAFDDAAHSDPALLRASASTDGSSVTCKKLLRANECNLDEFFLEEDDEGDETLSSHSSVFGDGVHGTQERAEIHAEIRDTFHGQPTDDHLVRLSSLRGCQHRQSL